MSKKLFGQDAPYALELQGGLNGNYYFTHSIILVKNALNRQFYCE